MGVLEHKLSDTRATIGRVLSRFGIVDPTRFRSSRLLVRMDDGDLPEGTVTEDLLGDSELRKLLIETMDRLGPLKVCFLASRTAGAGRVENAIRFAHRLECPTVLVTAGRGIDTARAEALVDSGLMQAQILIGGVSEGVQQSVVGASAIEATDAVMALLKAREDRRADLDLEIVIPWRGRVTEELRAVIGWARQVGVDGYRIETPWVAEDMPCDPELLDELGGVVDDFNRTHGGTLAKIHAMVAHQEGGPESLGNRNTPVPPPSEPIGSQRLELSVQRRTCAALAERKIPVLSSILHLVMEPKPFPDRGVDRR